jgi:choline dehydrogenase-like flavoprotein
MKIEWSNSFPASSPNYGVPPGEESTNRLWDVCIIGSGAAGSIAAMEIARHNLSVVMLEQGPFVDPHTTYDDLVRSSEPAYARQPNGCWALNGYPWTTCNVGGGTVFFGGAFFRYREIDFNPERFYPEADLPVRWPYDYTELRPYYDEVEKAVGVAADPKTDPTAPPQDTAHLLPPIARDATGEIIAGAASALGLRPFPTPLAIATVPIPGRPACNACTPCIEHRCPSGAKGDAFEVFLKPLLQQEPAEFKLFSGMKAVRLSRNQPSLVDSVLALRVDTGQAYRFRARQFIVACNAIQSSGLLLRSADSWSPQGLGNEHDLLGRGLCFKVNQYVTGWFTKPGESTPSVSLPKSNAGPFSTVALTDYYLDEEAPSGLGGLIYQTNYGFNYRTRSHTAAVRLECLLADRPSRDNRVFLSRETDFHGVNRLILDYNTHPEDAARLRHLVEKARALLREAGCRWIFEEPGEPALGSCHLHGTCRGGKEATDSVLDPWSRVHSLENVHVMDGAFMPYPGGVNPTLTIQAHALRCARHLARTA